MILYKIIKRNTLISMGPTSCPFFLIACSCIYMYDIIGVVLPCVNPSGLLVLWFCRLFTGWTFAPLWYGYTNVVQSAGDSGLLFQLFHTPWLTLYWRSPPVIAIITAFQWTTDVSEIQLSKNYRKVTTFL